MPSISGTYVGSGLSPGNVLNTHETHRALYGRGGYRTVATLTERNQITPLRREEGMLVYVTADLTTYRLKAGAPLSGNTSNPNWEIFTAGGGAVPDITGTILAAGILNLTIGQIADFKMIDYSLNLTSATKSYGEKVFISKDHTELTLPGFSKTEYAILGDILCTIELVITGPDLIIRITNNELVSVDYTIRV